MKNLLTLTILFLSIATSAQQPVRYKVTPQNLEHHEIRISVAFSEIEVDSLTIVMPNASPGRYAVHNFAKNVYDEAVYNMAGKPLNFRRASPYAWRIPVKNGYVRFEYTLFGNHADGTYAGVDTKKLHLNMPATFVYAESFDDLEIELTFDLEDYPDWSIATQLQRKGQYTLSAPNYYYFYDSPVLVGELSFIDWQVDRQMIEIALMHEGTEQEFEKYAESVKKIVSQQKAVFGELPNYDYGKYTFLCSYNPWVEGDAMEHRNSTVCTSKGNLAQHASYLIGSISHEFFHCWNIERIRPASLEPFDFDEANLSGELWFGEGFTNYYDELTMCRAEVIDTEKYLKTATGVLNYVMNSPGRAVRNPIQMSQNAPFVDAAKAVDETNYGNNFISYYSYGELLGMILDLKIRASFPGKSLDDYMKYIWVNYGKTEKPYSLKDLENALVIVTGSKDFSSDFFGRFIYDSQLPDFNKLYNSVGIKMELAEPGKVYMGKPDVTDGVIKNYTTKGTALYEAGLDRGDRILSVNGTELEEEITFEDIVKNLEVGKSYAISFEQQGQVKSSKFTCRQDPEVVLSLDPNASKGAISSRSKWLGPN